MLLPPNVIDGLAKLTSGFDFLIGEWTVANRRLVRPLSGGEEWCETTATATSATLHNGAISVDEMWYPDQGFAGTSIRVYSAGDDTWTIYWINSQTGHVQPSVTGNWSEDGSRFVATGPDEFNGIPILARYLWRGIGAHSATWEQAFSVDDGVTWETNWVMHWSRQT